MSNPYVRGVDRVTDGQGMALQVGVDYDAVSITIGLHSVLLNRAQCEEFARAFTAACWEAADNARLMAEEAAQ